MAVGGLRSLADAEIRNSFWQMLLDQDATVRRAAVIGLAFRGDSPPSRTEIDSFQRSMLVKRLDVVLKDEDASVRWAAAHTLGSYRDGNALRSLEMLM